MKQGSNYYFYQNDHLGTPQKLTAINGAVVWTAKYTTFGKASIEVGTVDNNLRFPGQYEDQETGLYYNLHRYYDPSIGRYLRTDPIGLNGGINLFVYALNNPISSIDAMGLDTCVWGGFSGDFVVGIGGQLVFQKGKCKNKCGEWEWKTRNCICYCVGISFGGAAGGEVSDDSSSNSGWGWGIGAVSGSFGPSGGVGYGWKYGLKKCWCHCDVF